MICKHFNEVKDIDTVKKFTKYFSYYNDFYLNNPNPYLYFKENKFVGFRTTYSFRPTICKNTLYRCISIFIYVEDSFRNKGIGSYIINEYTRKSPSSLSLPRLLILGNYISFTPGIYKFLYKNRFRPFLFDENYEHVKWGKFVC